MDQASAAAIERAKQHHLRRERDVDKPDLRSRKRRVRESTSLYVAVDVWAQVKALAETKGLSASETAEELLEWALTALNEPAKQDPKSRK